MCGLVGAVGALGHQEKEIVKQLFILDIIRGHHSSGIAVVNAEKKATVIKELETPFELFVRDDYKKELASDVNLLMCHNRYATRGATSVENAHPFEMEHIIGAHNGTIHTAWKMKDGNKFAVDSQAIFNNIVHEGVANTAKLINGAYALTWYNKEEGTFNIARNKERPLFYAFSKDMKTLFWASEDWMLQVAFQREQYHHYKITPVDVLKHYSLVVPSGKPNQVERFTSWTQEDIPDYEAPKFSNHSGINMRRAISNAYSEDDGPVYNNKELPRHSGGSVIPFPGGHSQKKSSPGVVSKARANALVGKTVVVTAVEPRHDNKVHHYIYTLHYDGGGSPVPIRCYVGGNQKLWNEMSVNGSKFSLQAKHVTERFIDGVAHYHLVADVRTIKAYKSVYSDQDQRQLLLDKPKQHKKIHIPSDMVEMLDHIEQASLKDAKKLIEGSQKLPFEDRYFETYRSQLMRGSDILRLCKDGCVWCGNPPDLTMMTKSKWVDHTEFVCLDCLGNQDALHTMKQFYNTL